MIASFQAGLIEYKSIAALQTYMYFGDCVKFGLLGDTRVIVGKKTSKLFTYSFKFI